ncbi:MAG: cyclase family protein [Akkermansiaceae bacterium]|nr:cyclase family protein [Armatimonadota bacterium]
MTKFYDITIPVQNGLAVWPGDTPFEFTLGWEMGAGASVNVGAVTMSTHTGTHVDAPFHFDADGAGVDTLDASVFVGPVAVVDAAGRAEIGRDVFAGVDFARTPRVLIRTGVWTDYARFPDAVPTLADDVPAFLGANGVRLLGVDVPSVDAIDSKTLPIHHALAAQKITILESIDLRDVPPGVYTLIALPLRLVGADASPVRAVLTTL